MPHRNREHLRGGSGSGLSALPGGSLVGGSVATAALADGSVTTAKILNGTVSSDDLATGAVTGTDILDGTITVDDIAGGSLATLRAYYQTSSTFAGNAALGACSAGFHMATLAEIFDTSSLRYAKEIPGAVQGQDSGDGPPYSITGWIRTGVGSGVNNQVGAGNCSLWTSNKVAHFGTTVGLNPDWLAAVTNISPWAGVTFTCNSSRRVWCVED